MNPIRIFYDNSRNRIKENKGVYIVFTVLRVLTVVAIVRSMMIGNYEAALTAFLSLLLFLVPSFIEGAFKLRMSPLFEGIIYGFIFASNILGEIAHFYAHIPIWDTLLHTLNGFLFAAVGFSTVDLLNRNNKKVNLSPLYLTLVAFCVSMSVGVLWEFFECGMDLFFNMDMQKDFIVDHINSVTLDPLKDQNVIHVKDITSTQIFTKSGEVYTIEGGYLDIGILDTMKDLFVNFIGAVVFCIFGYIYEKYGEKRKAAATLVKGLRIKPVEYDEKTGKEIVIEDSVIDKQSDKDNV